MTHKQNLDSTFDNQLSALLRSGPARQRCIQRVADHMNDIQQARASGHTWDVIAEAINMRRATLINAFNTLLARSSTHRSETFLSTPVRQTPLAAVPVLNMTKVVSTMRVLGASTANSEFPTQSQSPTRPLASGIVSLGRASAEKFNI